MKKNLVAFLMIFLCAMAIEMSASAEDITMKNKKWVTGQGAYFVDTDHDGIPDKKLDKGVIYYKVNIPQPGYIKVQAQVSIAPGIKKYYGDEYTPVGKEIYLGVHNRKKENLTATSSNNWKGKSETFIFIVKKGTYYLSMGGEEAYRMRYTFIPVKKVSKAGTKVSNAVKLRAGKKVKSLVFYDKLSIYKPQEDYYKVKLTEDKSITVIYNALMSISSDKLRFQLYLDKDGEIIQVDDEGNHIPKRVVSYGEVERPSAVFSGKGKIKLNLKKGTYYFRLFTRGSGYYTLKWR